MLKNKKGQKCQSWAIKINDGDKVQYKCLVCGDKILSADISEKPPWIMAFKGFMDTQNIPYCPKCNEIPKYNGNSMSLTTHEKESIMNFLV
ncbi:MAG: hypothetical protein K0B07_03825 [DPANN group archaeon]|nr:hypothetical protein [DPANN group archaeon]